MAKLSSTTIYGNLDVALDAHIAGSTVLDKALVGTTANFSGTVTAASFTGPLTGTASNATTLAGFTNSKSANPVNGPDSLANNGIAYVQSISLLGQTDGALYGQTHSDPWRHQIYGDYRTGQIAVRGKNSGTWQAWRTILDSSNYTTWAATKDHTHSTYDRTSSVLSGANVFSNIVVAKGIVTGTATRALSYSDVGAAPAHSHPYLPLDGGTMTGDIVYGTGDRDHSPIGTYDATKTQQIWAMGVAYKNSAAGTNFGNLYGLAYKHTNNTTGGTMAGGHQVAWVVNGQPKAAMGEFGVWSSNYFSNNPTITVNTTVPTGQNLMSVGPITINSGVTVTVPTGAIWTIV